VKAPRTIFQGNTVSEDGQIKKGGGKVAFGEIYFGKGIREGLAMTQKKRQGGKSRPMKTCGAQSTQKGVRTLDPVKNGLLIGDVGSRVSYETGGHQPFSSTGGES